MEAREEARSAPDDVLGLRGPPPAEFLIATPRVTRAKTTSELGHESPTQSQLVPGWAITSELYSILETNDIDVDEISSAAIERLNAMGLELRGAGYAETRSDAVIQLEWFIRDLIAKWRKEAAETGQRRTLAEWSLRQMMTTDFTKISNFDALELQIRGLGRLAGLSYAEATTHIERAWSSSTVGTRSQRSPDGASPGQVASSAAGTSATKPATAEKAAEFLAPNGAGGGSPNGARGGAPHAEPGFSTPRLGTRLPFGTPSVAGAALLGSPGSGPKGPWENLAQGGAVDIPFCSGSSRSRGALSAARGGELADPRADEGPP